MKMLLSLLAASLCAFPNQALSYAVGSPVNLEKLAAQADLIFKATAVSTAVVKDEWFKPVQSFEAWETEFKIVSLVKGTTPGPSLRFRHYDYAPDRKFWMYEPQHYHFEPGKTYIIFAKQGDAPGVYRQIWASHTGKEDQGALRCADIQPVTAATVKETVLNELKALLLSTDAADRTYGTKQLDQMTVHSGRFDATNDFDQVEVLKLTAGLMVQPDQEAARAAITVIGSGNPYLADERTEYWLATVGSAEVPGIGKMDPKMKNPGGELYLKELCAIADGKAETATRALAIRALGLVRNPALRPLIRRWLKDPEPAVRASATLLLADFPDNNDKGLKTVATDADATVRRCAATAIGFTQKVQLTPLLGALLKDADKNVRRFASLSLLSFSPRFQPVATLLKQNLGNQEFHPLFLNALASETPEAWLEPLATAVEQQSTPTNWTGGQIPAFTGWKILFNYLLRQSTESLRAGQFDRCLDALEKGYVGGSAEPASIYALYVQSDMMERAKKYRAAAVKAIRYDLNPYFDKVDQDPRPYARPR